MLNKKTVANVATIAVGVILAGVLMSQLPDVPGLREGRQGFNG